MIRFNDFHSGSMKNSKEHYTHNAPSIFNKKYYRIMGRAINTIITKYLNSNNKLPCVDGLYMNDE